MTVGQVEDVLMVRGEKEDDGQLEFRPSVDVSDKKQTKSVEHGL